MSVPSILEVLASRDGLADETLFVGRTEGQSLCAGLGTTQRVVWVSGARRVGKTAFAQQLRRKFVERNAGATIVSLDASGAKTFDDLLSRVLDRAGAPAERDPRMRFERFAEGTRTGAPALVMLDEFDRIAIDLGVDEQALLRRTTTDDRKLSYIIVSHIAPWRIMEEVSDVASRLMGVAQPVSIGMFAEGEVRELFERVATRLGDSDFGAVWKRAWDDVGGHPLSIVTILQRLACTMGESGADYERISDELNIQLGAQMASLWNDLSPGTRMLLLEPEAIKDVQCRGDAKCEGFVTRRGDVLRPRLLLAAGRNRASALAAKPHYAEETTFTLRLHDVVGEINASVKCKSGRAWFENTDEVRRQMRTMRPSHSENDFAFVVDHLSKVIYEAAREPDPARNPDADPMRWRIPEPHLAPFNASVGIKSLKAYRAYFDHDPDFNRNVDGRFEKHKSAGKAFMRACGIVLPHSADLWAKCHRALLADLVSAVEVLLQSLQQAAASPARAVEKTRS